MLIVFALTGRLVDVDNLGRTVVSSHSLHRGLLLPVTCLSRPGTPSVHGASTSLRAVRMA